MDRQDDQERSLRGIIDSARSIASTLGALQLRHGDLVHFRPGAGGVSMIGLSQERPQRGCSALPAAAILNDFEQLYAQHCVDVDQGRPTGEKALQSHLIQDAYRHGRRMQLLNQASQKTSSAVELHFVTDEIALPREDGKIVCDMLALRRDAGRSTPVVLELKNARLLKELRRQVSDYAQLVDRHAGLFAQLYSALLGEPVAFDGPAERWIVWPEEGLDCDPREPELARDGIRVVGYLLDRKGAYRFRVGAEPRRDG
ncbi:MAG TPA: hypothetical protein VMG12_15425 [Polyangiaceae bacterium]|nr:hypothetical protein [Polyangiaceae bacterium]